MRWMEIITLRSIETSAGSGVAALLRQILLPSSSSAQRPVDVKIYHLAELNTDFSIHIHWDGNAGSQVKSPLGLRLANNLKYIGLINHSIWIENGG